MYEIISRQMFLISQRPIEREFDRGVVSPMHFDYFCLKLNPFSGRQCKMPFFLWKSQMHSAHTNFRMYAETKLRILEGISPEKRVRMKSIFEHLLWYFKTKSIPFLAPKWIHNLIAIFIWLTPNRYMISCIHVFNVHIIGPNAMNVPSQLRWKKPLSSRALIESVIGVEEQTF